MMRILPVSLVLGLLFNTFSPAHSQSVSMKWQYPFQPGTTRMLFGSSPAIRDLGPDVNRLGGEPVQNMEIVTGSDEYSNVFPELGAPAYGLWRCFDSEGNLEWVTDTKSDEARTSPVIVDLNSDLNFEIGVGTTSGWCVEVMNRLGSWTGGVADEAWTFPYPPQRDGPFMWHSSPAAANLATGPSLAGLEIVIGSNYLNSVWAFDGDNSDRIDDGITVDLSGWGYPGPVGTEGVDWDVLWVFQTGGSVMATPAADDVDGDGQVEVVVGSDDGRIYCLNGANGMPEWSYLTGAPVHGSAGLADFDNDGDLEVIIGSTDGRVYCIDGDENGNGLIDATEVVVFNAGLSVLSSPAIGDVDNDGKYEILIGTESNRLYCLEYSPALNTVTESWRFEGALGGNFRSSPAIANSGRATLTIYAGSSDGKLYILDGTGAQIAQYNTGGQIISSPAVADIDGDGKLEIAFIRNGSPDVFVVLRDDNSSVEPYASEWPGFRHDEARTGLYPWTAPAYNPDIATIQILAPAGAHLRDSPITPRAIVKNVGEQTEMVPVVFTITDGGGNLVYSSTKDVTLASQENAEVSFDPYANTLAGHFAGRCSTALVGDRNPENDVKVKGFIVLHPQWVEHFDRTSGGFAPTGFWEWGVPTSGPGAAYSGDKLWATILAGNYHNHADWRLKSTDYKATQSSPVLLFYHWYDFERSDGGNVKLSTDGGATWQLVTPLEGYPGIATWDNVGIADQPCYTDESGGWQLAVFTLPVTNGQVFKLRWDFGSDDVGVRSGWYLDDVMGIGFYRLNHDVAARQILGVAETVRAGTAVQPSVVVENWGGFDETFPVSLVIPGTSYSETQVVSLPVGGVATVPFGPWTAELGSYSALAFTALVGDEDLANDTTRVEFEVVPAPSLAIDDVSVVEGNVGTTEAVFTVHLVPAATQTVTVDFSTMDGSATVADGDYEALAGTLTFSPGEQTKPVHVVVKGDTKVEPDEVFFVVLSNPTGATLADAEGQGTIVDDDAGPPTINVSLTPRRLWPPNHKMVPIHATVKATGQCTPGATLILLSLTSSEPDEGTGDGDFPNDIQDASVGTPDFNFRLRAERSGKGEGRMYVACYGFDGDECNRVIACDTVLVPHDKRGRAAFLSVAEGGPALVIFGDPRAAVRQIVPGSVQIGSESFDRLLVPGSADYRDVDQDGLEDVVHRLGQPNDNGAAETAEKLRPECYARWANGNLSFQANLDPTAIVGAGDRGSSSRLTAYVRPNPTHGLPSIFYTLPAASHVRLSIYDILGREIARPLDRQESAGPHELPWRPSTVLAPGVYFYRLLTPEQTVEGRFVVVE